MDDNTSQEFNSEFVSEELGSEEVSSEEVSSEVVYTESVIPDSTLNQIAEIHSTAIIGLALFGSLFFLIAFDIIYKKLSRFFQVGKEICYGYS